jgi:proline iminopeptidase
VDLYCRDVGAGPPIIVLHGGPDFDHAYFLPELDRLADSFRLLYYDQRGRGRSAEGVRPEDVTLRSELDDLDRVRSHFGLASAAVLGHSWGGVLAMEYAVRHPERVSRLILMDTGPASADDWRRFREELAARRPADRDAMQAIASTDAYARGDLEAEAAYYRIHFRITVQRPDHLELLVARLRSNFTEDGVGLARESERRI